MTDDVMPSAEMPPTDTGPTKDEPDVSAARGSLVRLEGIHKKFGRLHVLKGIDLDVSVGEKVSIIGPSGSGKTTLLRCINYIEKPNEGHVYVNGHLLGE